jgi:hypothetical protein
MIEYTPGFNPPAPIVNPELPSYVFQDQSQSLSDMDFIANQFEVSQGRTPPGVEAASAIAYLQEENDSILSDVIASIEELVERVGYQSIMLAHQYWPEDKLVKIMSGDQVFEVMQFKQGTLPEQVDFKVEHGSMAPRSRAAKQALIMELMKEGILPPIEALSYLEMSETSRLYADLQVDKRHVERENFKMKQGQPVMVNTFDNHNAHVFNHAKFMKTQGYEVLDEKTKAIFLGHYQQHLVTLGKEIEDARTAESGPGAGQPESGGGNPPA